MLRRSLARPMALAFSLIAVPAAAKAPRLASPPPLTPGLQLLRDLAVNIVPYKDSVIAEMSSAIKQTLRQEHRWNNKTRELLGDAEQHALEVTFRYLYAALTTRSYTWSPGKVLEAVGEVRRYAKKGDFDPAEAEANFLAVTEKSARSALKREQVAQKKAAKTGGADPVQTANDTCKAVPAMAGTFSPSTPGDYIFTGHWYGDLACL